MLLNISKYRKPFFACILIALAVSERIFFDLGSNIELVTLASLLASCYLGLPYALVVPFSIMLISDTIIGNTAIFIFTWSAYILIGLGALFLKHFRKSGLKLPLVALPTALASSLFFYLWTNFGVWLQGWYLPTLQGLIKCYLMGLPFLKYNLVSNVLIVPAVFIVIELGKREVYGYMAKWLHGYTQ